MIALRNLRHVSASRTTSIHVTAVRFKGGGHKPLNTNFNVQRGQPAFIYGTAWKKDQTKELVKEALAAGFRRFDTAAQPKHYQEDLVGEALREAISEGIVKRNSVYVSFTPWQTPMLVKLTRKNRYKPSSRRQLAKIMPTCPMIPMLD